MQPQLRQTLLALKSNSPTDEILISGIESLARKEGPHVLQQTFKLFGDVDLPLYECNRHWDNLLSHRTKLLSKLERPISITIVFCDYLHYATQYLKNPRIIETAHYETTLAKSHHDSLTGLFNRNYFNEAYCQQVAKAKRYTEEFTILFLDIDNFKCVNDIYGHKCGDIVLKRIADIISEEKRDSDIAARFGGEEFILLLTHSDNISSFVFAERLRNTIAKEEFVFADKTFKITISGGVASFPFNSSNPEELIEMADTAMYLSKGAGKNRISHYKDEKRRYIRIKIKERIRLKELNFTNTPALTGTSIDICVGGILFENEEALPIGALLSVEIQLTPDQEPVILIGYIIRVKRLATGRYNISMTTSFKELDDIVNKEIASIIAVQ
ncbi:MAG: hypothetical protein COA36_17240 [Desulfotalea sp.]|nr:MAG: hypothetical protein COA36_17240 [Desulfotalea sp.]